MTYGDQATVGTALVDDGPADARVDLNYLTRSTLSVAAPKLLQDWTSGAAVLLDPATFQGAIMLQPICGYVLDVVGLKSGWRSS